MKNKFYMIMGLMLVFLLIASSNVLADELGIVFQQQPFPIQAGSQGVLTFIVTNTGTDNLTDLSFNLEVDSPITLNSAAEKNIFLMQPGETRSLTYNIYVEGDANGGKEQVTLNYELNGHKSDDFDVLISPQQVYLQIENVNTIPGAVAPGENLTLNLELRNTADSGIKDIIISLDLSQVPFAPESVTEQRIDSMGKQESQDIKFKLIALSSAEIKVYKIPLTITYFDDFGKMYQRSDFISIEVFEKPSIDVIVEKDSLVIGMSSKLTLNVLNKGLGKVTFVEAKILPSEDYSIQGSDYNYIGNIESDDYSSIEFSLSPKKQNFNVVISLEYRDANNQKYTETKIVPIRAYTSAEAQRAGILPGFPWLLVIILVVVVALIIYFIIRRRNKKAKIQQGLK